MRVSCAFSSKNARAASLPSAATSTAMIHSQMRAHSGTRPPSTSTTALHPNYQAYHHKGSLGSSPVLSAQRGGIRHSVSIRDALNIGGSNGDFDGTHHLKCLSEVLPKVATDAVVKIFKDVGTEALNAYLASWKDGPPADCPRGIVAIVEPFIETWWDAARDAAPLHRDAAKLSSYGIHTLSEFANSRDLAVTIVSAKTYHRINMAHETGMCNTAQEADMGALWCCYKNRMLDLKGAKLKQFHLANQVLGRTPVFVGEDRLAIVARVCKSIEVGTEDSSKEANPIHVVFGAPRTGKSRVLDEISRTLNRSDNILAIPITFNNGSPMDDDVQIVDDDRMKIEWFSRITHSLCAMYVNKCIPYEDVLKQPFWSSIELFDVLNFAKQLSGKRNVTIIADEANRIIDLPQKDDNVVKRVLLHPLWGSNCAVVLSGFVSNIRHHVCWISGRSSVPYALVPVNAGTAHSYTSLRTAACRVTSLALFQSIRFCPGLMGLAVESAMDHPVDTLSLPIIDVLQKNNCYGSLFDSYWAQVANATSSTQATGIGVSNGLGVCEDMGIVLHEAASNVGVLNPYYLVHFAAETHSDPAAVKAMAPLMSYLAALKLWGEEPSSNARKGAVLEALLLCALQLRASYMTPMDATTFFTLMTGDCVPTDKAFTVTLNSDIRVSTLVSFPLHSKSNVCYSHRKSIEPTANYNATKDLILSEGGFIARVTAKFNSVCDIVIVGRFDRDEKNPTDYGDGGGKFCIMYETRQWENLEASSKDGPSKKAFNALLGVLQNYPSSFKRVSFVYMTTCQRDVFIDPKFAVRGKSIKYLIDQLARKGCVATVHVVDCSSNNSISSATFRSIMMQSLMYLVPSFELSRLRKKGASSERKHKPVSRPNTNY